MFIQLRSITRINVS